MTHEDNTASSVQKHINPERRVLSPLAKALERAPTRGVELLSTEIDAPERLRCFESPRATERRAILKEKALSLGAFRTNNECQVCLAVSIDQNKAFLV